MKLSKINVDGVETLISLGISENEIEKNEREYDTIKLDDVIKGIKEIQNEEDRKD